MQVELWKLSDVKPYQGNPRLNDEAVEAVAASIREFGFRQPIVVDAATRPPTNHTTHARYQIHGRNHAGGRLIQFLRTQHLTIAHYSEDARLFTGFGDSQATGPALFQNGKYYVMRPSFTVPDFSWVVKQRPNLQAEDFDEVLTTGIVQGNVVDWWDDASHPNFSDTGTPIEVGFYRANRISTGNPGFTRVGGIDNWSLRISSGTVLYGDVNSDGAVTLLDIAPFVQLLTSGKFQAEADFNCDGVVNQLDVQPFVESLAGG